MKQLNTGVLLALLIIANSSSAQSIWNGGGADDNWNTPLNWGGSAPASGANLQFGGTTRLTPVNNFAADTLFNSITFNAGAGAFNLTGNRIRLGGSIINNDDSLQSIGLELALTGTRTITGGTAGITLNGAVSQSGGTYGLNTNGFVTLTAGNTYGGTTTINAGTLALTGSGSISDSSPVNLAQSGSIFDISGISGASETVASLAGVAGSSVIVGGKTLSAGGGTTFSGSMSGTGGSFTKTGAGTLTLSSATWTQTGTTTVSAGTLQLTNSSITGGTINNSSTGTISIGGTSIIGGTLTNPAGGQININRNSTLKLQSGGSYTNDGIISMQVPATYLRITGDLTISGTGRINMVESNDNFIVGDVGTGRLTNDTGHTIQGVGFIGNNLMALTNSGNIIANSGNFLIIDPNAAGAVNSASGVIRGASGSFSGLTFQNGSLTNAGLIEATAGGKVSLSAATIDNTGGLIRTVGNGVISVTNSTITGGEISNSSTGTINFGGTSNLGGTLSNPAGGQININQGATLKLQSGGSYTNDGTISMLVPTTNLKITGDVTISGTGRINMIASNDNYFVGDVGTERLTNGTGHTIQGVGFIGNNVMALTNQGNIIANAGNYLIIDPNGAGAINSATGIIRGTSGSFFGLTFQNGSLTNAGLVEATNGGKVTLNSALVDNTGGTVQVVGASTLQLTNSIVTGGALSNSSTGTIDVGGASTFGGTLFNSAGGQIVVGNGATLKLQSGGSYTNNGDIRLTMTNSAATLRIAGDVSLAGSGALTLTSTNDAILRGDLGTERLTNESGHTIQGTGKIGANLMALTNHGTIVSNWGNSLTIDPNVAGAINSVTGVMRAANGASLLFENGSLANSGLLEAVGTLGLGSATINNTGTGIVQSSGTGIINLVNSTVSGGTLINSAAGTINVIGTSTIGGTVINPAGGQIIVAGNNNTLNLQGSSSYTNNGNIAINGTSNFSTQIRILSDVTLSGSGAVTMNNSSSNFMIGAAGTERLTNDVGHTIRGAGSIGNNLMTLTNNGTILADRWENPMVINPNSSAVINASTGVMRSQSGALLSLFDGTFSNSGLIETVGSTLSISGATIQNSGGTVQTVNAGTLNLSNGHIFGGIVNNSATGTFNIIGSSTLSGTVTNSSGGQIVIAGNNNILNLQNDGTYINNGNIALNGTGNFSTQIRLMGDAALSGSGTVTMNNTNSNQIIGNLGTERLTNDVNHTIQGSGFIGNNLALTNLGTIVANNGGNPITIDPNADGAINGSSGTMRAISSSTLTFQNGSLTNNGLVEANTAGVINFGASTVLNTDGIVRAASGTLNLTNSTISGGTVELTGSANLNLTTSTISGGTLTNSGTGSITALGVLSGSSSTISSPITLSGSNSLSAASNRVLHLTGGISKDATTTTFSGGTINVSGTGISGTSSNSNIVLLGSSLNLTAANTYGGSTTLSGGTLTVSGSGTLPDTTAVNFTSSSTLNLSGITASSETIGSLAGTAGSVVLGGKNLTTGGNDTSTTFAGAISGTLGSLTKTGTGTMILSGSNSYTGVTTFASGTLSVATIGNGGVAGNLGQATAVAANLVFDGGALQYTGTNAGTNRNYTINAGKTAVFDITTNNLTLNGASAATTGALTKTGTGTLTLAVTQGHTGLTTVNAGTLAYGVSNALSTGGVTVDGAGAILNLGSFNDTVGAVIVDNGGTISGTGTLTSTVGFEVRNGTISVPISGAVGVSKDTPGTVTASVGNNYSGSTTINNGTLQVTANNALGSNASGTTVGNGATLLLTGVNYATSETLTLNGSGFSGGGALRNSGTSTFAGPITAITNASIHAGGGSLTLTGGLEKNGTILTLTGGGTINVNTVGISGASANSDLVVDGTTANLNTANTYNGPTFIRNGGTLNANVVNALPSSPRTHVVMDDTGVGSSILTLGASQNIASLSGAASSTVNLASHELTIGASTGDGTFAGSISGSGSLIKEGANTQTLAGPSTYSGGTSVNSGGLNITNTTGSATGSGEVLIDASATLSGTGRMEAAINTNFEINGKLTVGDSTLSSPVASSFTLTTSGTGEVLLGGLSQIHFDLFSGAGTGDNTANAGSADHIQLFGRLDTAFDALIVIENPNSMTSFAYGDKWKLFDLAGGLITESSSFVLNVDSLGLNSGLVATFDATTGLLSIVPEPHRFVLLLTGLGACVARRRRQANMRIATNP